MIGLAPDQNSEVAGRKLAVPGPWSEVGWQPPLLWGDCQGSGKSPYHIAIDTSGPKYECTCPSYKFPCKHVLGLLFLWAEGRVEQGGGLTPFVAEWQARQERKAGATPERAEQTEEQQRAAAARAEQRDQRVADGLGELGQWLADHIRTGLAHVTPVEFETLAARMIDAQVPGVASRLRGLAYQVMLRPEDILEELALLHLLVRAHANRAALPPELWERVRTHLGYQTSRDEVLATPGVGDRWVVVGMRDSDDEQVATRRVWLWGTRTGRRAVVLLFAPAGQQFDTSFIPELSFEGDLHFYPGRGSTRALVSRRDNDEHHVSGWRPGVGGVSEALAGHRAALAEDPWTRETLAGALGTVRHGAAGWSLVGDDDARCALTGPADDLWRLLAATRGRPAVVFGELSRTGLRPTSVIAGERLVAL